MRRLLLAAAALVPALAAAGLTPDEEALVRAVKDRSPAALELLERAVRVNSGTLNIEGVREVGAIFARELASLGFATRWVEMPEAMHRAGHLLATRSGSRGKRLLLLGHIDTVFEKESAAPLWNRAGPIVHGQGVNDMKGGDVVIVEALRALAKVGALEGATITVLLTGDEERPGTPIAVARAPLVEAAQASDVALSFEAIARDKDGGYRAIPGRRGSSGWTLEVEAKPGHGAYIFSQESGYGAVFEGARILDAFRRELHEEGLTFNPGLAAAGSSIQPDESTASATVSGKVNVIAARMHVEGDLRFLDPVQHDRAVARMRDIVAASLPGTHASLAIHDAYPPMPASEGNLRLLAAYSKASDDAGLGAVGEIPATQRAANDIEFAAPFADSLDGLGTNGRGAHSDEEQMDLASVERGAIRAALLIYRLTR